MKKITNYSQLNKKYDLNFSDNNFGFTWEIFKELVGDDWAEYFTTRCFYRFVPTARMTFKTWNCLAWDLWICCNFTDTSAQEVRRYENTHPETTIADLHNLCQYLEEKYGVQIGPEHSKVTGIVWKLNKEGGEIIFPSNQRITFIGYANGNRIFGTAVKGSSFLCSRTDEIIMAEEKETLSDKQLIYRYERLQMSMFRSNRIKVSDKSIKELSWTFVDKMTGQQETRYLWKSFFVAFTCNLYDKYHPFYKKYCTPFLPLNDKIMNLLKETGKVWYENEKEFEGLGIFVLRLTLDSTWNKLPEISRKKVNQLKKDNPDEYAIVKYGFEYSDSDSTIFPFRKHLKYTQKYDLKDFYVATIDMYKFDFYSIGIDWATGPIDHTVLKFWGFQEYKKTELYDPYLICEIVITPEDNFSENEKISHLIEEIMTLRANFYNFADVIFNYDDKAKTAMEWIKTKLIEDYSFNIRTSTAIKHTTPLTKEAGLTDRVIWMRNLFGFGNCHINLQNNPFTAKCYEELRYDEKRTNVPDPKMYLDPYDADFYALYPNRVYIRGKQKGYR
ncbi:hypothetical protein [Spiroplasma endosymbiont of Clivina fossor]|uniref:hypothetical protein n=1 Tax=Spiroplasma endosymbiont of Clivina fossor TaxID=3066282 RepID=UPI00313CE4F0